MVCVYHRSMNHPLGPMFRSFSFRAFCRLLEPPIFSVGANLWTRLSCHRFVANRVRLSLFVLAYNLGNFLRRLCLPKTVKHWSLRSVQVKLIKMGGRLVRHSRWLIFQLAEVSVPRRLFEGVLDRIGRLSPAPS